MAVRKYLNLCSKHITRRDDDILTHLLSDKDEEIGKRPVVGHQFVYGYFIVVPRMPLPSEKEESDVMINPEDYYVEYRALGLSEAFINCLKFAAKKACDWILFHDDGDFEPKLERFSE